MLHLWIWKTVTVAYFRYIDPEEPIDLLNVAFEQQRPHQSKFQKGNKQEAEMK